jgi:hypothetical protein
MATDDFTDERRLPSGWWILPSLVGSIAFWGAAIWLLMHR